LSTFDWLSDLYVMIKNGSTDKAIDLLIDEVDDLLSDGEFERCDDLMGLIDLDRLDVDLLVGVLSVTLGAAELLPSRPGLIEQVEERLEGLVPERVDALMEGLADEWIDAAPLRLKRVGRIKVKIRSVRKMTFTPMEGDFEEDQPP